MGDKDDEMEEILKLRVNLRQIGVISNKQGQEDKKLLFVDLQWSQMLHLYGVIWTKLRIPWWQGNGISELIEPIKLQVFFMEKSHALCRPPGSYPGWRAWSFKAATMGLATSSNLVQVNQMRYYCLEKATIEKMICVACM